MLIINELKYAENLLKSGFSLPYHKRFKDIFVLAKYYKYLGLKDQEIQNKLYEFLNKYDKEFDINTSNKDREIVSKIAYSVNNKNFNIRIIDSIIISNSDLIKIMKLKGKQLQNLALILCVYCRILNKNKDIRIQFNDLMEFTNIQSLFKLNELFYQLEELGYVEEKRFKLYDILFVNLNDDCDMEVKKYNGCQICGRLIKNYNTKKYCFDCAKIIKNNQNKLYYFRKNENP